MYTPNEQKVRKMSTDVDKITVSGFFGDKEVTKQEFAKQWTDHIAQLRRLTYSQQWQQKVDAILDQVRTQAEDEFVATYIEQQNNI